MSLPEGVIIVDGWVVAGPQESQRQHAVIIVADQLGNEWATFHCGAGGATKHGLAKKVRGEPVQRPLDDLHVVSRNDQIPDREVCKQGWCKERHDDWMRYSDVHRERREQEAEQIAKQMPLTREALMKLERRLVRL